MEKKISILITNYNKDLFLEDCIISCLKQNYKNFEILLADNFSTDNSRLILSKYFKKIRIFQFKRSYPEGAANQLSSLLKMINETNGDYICLLDSDDYFEINKLDFIKNFFIKNKEVDLIIDQPMKIYDNYKIKMFKNKKYTKFIWPTIFPTSSLSFKRDVFNKIDHIFFDSTEDFNLLEFDFRIQVYFFFILKKFEVVDNYLTNYRILNDGIMSKQKKFNKLWWKKRMQAHKFIKIIHEHHSLFYRRNLDNYVTSFINFWLR
jgi:glycosyltransferase involved in cell wall biosynthesis